MPGPAFNPNLPANNPPIVAAELRNQLNALQSQITALQQQMGTRASAPTMGEFDPGFGNPPTQADLLTIQGFINTLVQQLKQ